MALFHRVVLINVSAVACLAAAAAYGFATSGSGDGGIAVPVPDARTAGYCRALHDALPQKVQGLSRHGVGSRSELVTGWGDPAIVLRCGVPRPAVDDDPEADGVDADGVSWSVEKGSGGSLVLTTTLRLAYVEVRLPKEHAVDIGPLTDLAAAVKKTIPEL
ncbi:DUF3515 domain-containing protein [Actinacidiphila bryophytorum]|uniref:DUF3515 domain-containing protein n=1 Tax=Actinacidiphila bryophytorum TaxID=1436133 RepID=UPI002176EEE6|nr:DUF3515 domain-containing protein [Actinacidiphila bryophytorum]UWE11990.1 DUF3515 domain-containing protein [Actinacidiphila bryophytorum]